ncbi:hypothetical protein T439DRAFT_326088 [Meredithblackwellia eburnea MCA 4105]
MDVEDVDQLPAFTNLKVLVLGVPSGTGLPILAGAPSLIFLELVNEVIVWNEDSRISSFGPVTSLELDFGH